MGDLAIVQRAPPSKRIRGWMNIFSSAYPKSGLLQGAVLYATKEEEADEQPGAARRIACLEIDVEAEELVKGKV